MNSKKTKINSNNSKFKTMTLVSERFQNILQKSNSKISVNELSIQSTKCIKSPSNLQKFSVKSLLNSNSYFVKKVSYFSQKLKKRAKIFYHYKEYSKCFQILKFRIF